MTLATKRGNAFDTASLTIALLRAANIPARYVYGSIEVPADKAMNWVGGVSVPKAAQELLGQGGIPNLGMASGGQISAIRLEHVWVEAWVDFVPSQGAVNRSGDTWVPMDASFKQYAYTNGMNLQNNVPFDA
jgi:transglutaminase-like putative cysteine protease